MKKRERFDYIVLSAVKFWAKICHLKDAEAGDYAKKFFRAISFGEEFGLNFKNGISYEPLLDETRANSTLIQNFVEINTYLETEKEKAKLLAKGVEIDE